MVGERSSLRVLVLKHARIVGAVYRQDTRRTDPLFVSPSYAQFTPPAEANETETRQFCLVWGGGVN